MTNVAYPMAFAFAIPALVAVLILVPRSLLRVPQSNEQPRRRLLSYLHPRNMLRALCSAFSVVNLPRTIMALMMVCVGAAITGPTYRHLAVSSDIRTQGRAILLAMDNSISMKETFAGKLPQLKYFNPFFENANDVVPNPDKLPQRRIDAGSAVVLKFVENRMEKPTAGVDEVGLITFAQRPRLAWPLDTSLMQIRRQGSFVPKTEKGDGLLPGTNFGREMPGPIDLAADEFVKHAKSTQRVLVLITDGEDKIDKEIRARLLTVMKDAGIVRFYVIGLGPKLKDENADIQLLCKEFGNGKVFHADNALDLDNCMVEIDATESATVTVPVPIAEDPLFWLPLCIALVLMGFYITTELLLHGR